MRPQFSLLWVMACVACFLGGMATGTKIEVMRNELEVGPPLHLNAKGDPAKPGEPITEIRHTINLRVANSSQAARTRGEWHGKNTNRH